jgi:hypothetical protein
MTKIASRGEAQRWIDAHVDYNGQGCLIWPFSGNSHGYGRVWNGGKMRLVSRIMCERRHGPPPSQAHDSAHLCGNGHLGCCHPGHLVWKTKSENQEDRIAHGTMIRGAAVRGAKLSESDVLAIRSAKHIPQKDLAAMYGVARSTLSQIMNHKRWSWL